MEDFTIKVKVDTSEVEAAMERLHQASHYHKYARLSDTHIFCECGSILAAPQPWQYGYSTGTTIGSTVTTYKINQDGDGI